MRQKHECVPLASRVRLRRQGSLQEFWSIGYEVFKIAVNGVLYARIKVHSHASHTPLSCALSGICHASQASMYNLRRMSHVLNSLKIPIYGNFSGTSRHPCALC